MIEIKITETARNRTWTAELEDRDPTDHVTVNDAIICKYVNLFNVTFLSMNVLQKIFNRINVRRMGTLSLAASLVLFEKSRL